MLQHEYQTELTENQYDIKCNDLLKWTAYISINFNFEIR